MSLAIFKRTYLLGELTLHERARDREKIKTCVKVAFKMPDHAFNYLNYRYFS